MGYSRFSRQMGSPPMPGHSLQVFNAVGKSPMMTLSITALLALSAPAWAQGFAVNEVLIQPSTGAPVVEITNSGATTLDTADARVVIAATHEQLASVPLPPGGFVRVHVGVTGINTMSDLFAPTLAAPPLAAGSVALYEGQIVGNPADFFADPTHILDFVQWGGPDQAFADVAEFAGVWFGNHSFVPSPDVDESIAVWNGSGSVPLSWFRDTSPTLGDLNVQPTRRNMDS